MIAALARLLHARRRRGLIVTPSTILRWHRLLLGRRSTTPPGRPGRPAIPAGVRALVPALGHRESDVGYRRIQGELAGLGYWPPRPPHHPPLRHARHTLDRNAANTLTAYLARA